MPQALYGVLWNHAKPAAQAQVQFKCVVFLSSITQKEGGIPKGKLFCGRKLRAQLMADGELWLSTRPGEQLLGFR